MVIGPGWQEVVDEVLPGSVAPMRQDAGTFFDVDLPAPLAWQFTSDEAARIGYPVCCTSAVPTAHPGSRRSASCYSTGCRASQTS